MGQWNEQIPVGDYARLAGEFHPDHFDANAWAELAKQGGSALGGISDPNRAAKLLQ